MRRGNMAAGVCGNTNTAQSLPGAFILDHSNMVRIFGCRCQRLCSGFGRGGLNIDVIVHIAGVKELFFFGFADTQHDRTVSMMIICCSIKISSCHIQPAELFISIIIDIKIMLIVNIQKLRPGFTVTSKTLFFVFRFRIKTCKDSLFYL